MSISGGPNIIKNGLVLYLDAADDSSYVSGSTVWKDISGNSNNGTLTNGPTFNTGSKGGIVFDGTNDYINITNISAINNSTNLTITSWFNATTLTPGVNGWSPLFSQRVSDSGYRPAIEIVFGDSDISLTPRQFVVRINTDVDSYGYTTSEVITAGNWYNMAMVYNGGGSTNSDKIKIYINGINTSLTFSGTIPTQTAAPAGDARIGGMLFNLQKRYFNGKIPITFLHKKSLSQSEILQNFNSTKGRYNL